MQLWRNLQHSQPDSSQPASEEVGTVHIEIGTCATLHAIGNVPPAEAEERYWTQIEDLAMVA